MLFLLWYFVVFTALGQAHMGIYPDEHLCRMAREGIMIRLPDDVPALTTPCAPATVAQLEGIGAHVPTPPPPPIKPDTGR